MSTGDVRRPSLNKVSKAVAADGPEPDVIDSTDATDAPEGEAPAKAKATPTTRPGAKSAAKAGTRTTSARPAKATGRPAGKGPAKSGGGKGRKPIKAVKVSQGRNWGPIAMFGGTALVAVLIIGFGAFALWDKSHQPTWQDRAAKIQGIVNFRADNPPWLTAQHQNGVLTFQTNPPVGGNHNPQWQNCMGDVYTAQIPKEQAVHSLEHGAVWVTYRPDLPKDQVDQLASKVRDKSFLLMSPYPGLDKPVSLQAWGYQLKVDNASDTRIDAFIDALRQNATQEPQATCSGGITDTGDKPLDMVQSGGQGDMKAGG